jgi:hypothetical protein
MQVSIVVSGVSPMRSTKSSLPSQSHARSSRHLLDPGRAGIPPCSLNRWQQMFTRVINLSCPRNRSLDDAICPLAIIEASDRKDNQSSRDCNDD